VTYFLRRSTAQAASVVCLAAAADSWASSAQAGTLVLTGGNWAFPGSGGAAEAYGVAIYDQIVSLAGGFNPLTKTASLPAKPA
jgi:cyanophycinase